MPDSTGKFIVIEGQGFTGKTTQAKILVEKLTKAGIQAIETREPGGVEEAEKIRQQLLKRREEGSISAEEEVKLFYQARKAFVEQLVKPSLEKGVWVVSTRFSPSTFVYQGIERGVNLELIKKIDQDMINMYTPDVYILLDVTEDEIWKRMEQDNMRQKHGYNEMDKNIIHTRREGYLKLTSENSGANWVVVDANGSVDQTSQKIWEKVAQKFNLHSAT